MGYSGKPSKGCAPCRAKRTKYVYDIYYPITTVGLPAAFLVNHSLDAIWAFHPANSVSEKTGFVLDTATNKIYSSKTRRNSLSARPIEEAKKLLRALPALIA
jgi:hypothetical protein